MCLANQNFPETLVALKCVSGVLSEVFLNRAHAADFLSSNRFTLLLGEAGYLVHLVRRNVM